MADRETTVFMAEVAEQAERYTEMVELVKELAKAHQELSVEERNLFAVAYKNTIGSRRASWRIVSSIEQKEDGSTYSSKIKDYRENIEKELDGVCDEVFDLLDNHLLPHATSDDARVFFYKMKGDYFRYRAEYSSGDKRKQAADGAAKAYEEANKVATEKLSPNNPLRLGLALNYSVFLYEIANQPDEAIKTAKEAFDQSIAEIQTMSEEDYREASVVMQLLRDNLTLWTSDLNDDEEDDDDDDDKKDE
ncbi:DNA damage checkpoint protein rad24 [Balamuthia mandrillaris]